MPWQRPPRDQMVKQTNHNVGPSVVLEILNVKTTESKSPCSTRQVDFC